MTDSVLTETHGRVGLIRFNRPEAMNALNADVVAALAAAIDDFEANPDIGCLVLTGSDTVVSLKPQFLLDGLASVHSEFVRISFTTTENPNKPGPVLITSQSSSIAGVPARSPVERGGSRA